MKKIVLAFLFSPLFFFSYAQQTAISGTDIDAARRIRTIELNDPIRPSWHLTIAEGVGYPFDPNGAIYKDGVYHLWHLYQDQGKHKWQHVSSIDLFHWRWHSNNLQPNPGDPDEGIFSGNAFLANDGNVVMAYHGVGTGGNCVAFSSDKDLNSWQKPKANPIAKPGWDPHMWCEGDNYFQLSGGTPVSDGKPNPPILYTGKSYKEPMQLTGNFMTNDLPGVDDFEDISCPDFFKLGDKWVLLCISHIRGARYYIGDWDGKKFKPQYHHRMNWPGGSVFAPETLIDSKGRRIMWAWMLDRKSGSSSGTMTMPRVLTLAKDKQSLNIEPPKEVELLRYEPKEEKAFTLLQGQTKTLQAISGNSLELDITISPYLAKKFGAKVFCSPDRSEQTSIVIDMEKKTIRIEMKQSSLEKVDYKEFTMIRNPESNTDIQEAPFELKKGEKLHLRIFLDKSTLEVFANGRQCISQVVYPTLKDAVNVQLFTADAPVKIEKLQAWKLFPAMQW